MYQKILAKLKMLMYYNYKLVRFKGFCLRVWKQKQQIKTKTSCVPLGGRVTAVIEIHLHANGGVFF